MVGEEDGVEMVEMTMMIPRHRMIGGLARVSTTRDRMEARIHRAGGLDSGLVHWVVRQQGMRQVEQVAETTRRLALDGVAAGGIMAKEAHGRHLGHRVHQATRLRDMRAQGSARLRVGRFATALHLD